MRYSARTGRWYGRPERGPAGPNPYDPSSPGFTERNRERVIDLPGGLQRVDLGAPIVSHPAQGVPPADPIGARLAKLATPTEAEPQPERLGRRTPVADEAAGRFRLSPTLDR